MTISMKDSRQHDSRPVNRCRTGTLLARGRWGRCPSARPVACTSTRPSISVRLTESDFLRLVSMFSNAATTLLTLRTRAVPDQVQ